MSDFYTPLRTPFPLMSFSPDIPSNALSPSEYNSGRNVECDVRGVKKVSGEQPFLSDIPGNAVFWEGGFRGAEWTYIVATREGKWYKLTAAGRSDITPGGGTLSLSLIHI